MSEGVSMDITTEEENTFLFYYQLRMLGTCDKMNIPIQVQSTVITYFKILFTKRRVFHYDMKNLIMACILLGMKVENIYITATQIKEMFSFVDTQLLAEYELEICNALKFNLYVPSPHLRLLALFLLLRNRESINAVIDGSVQTQEITSPDVHLNWETSIENLKTIMLLDNYHTLDLTQVAIASLPVSPSLLQGFFMEDTLNAVAEIKKQMKRKDLPTQTEINKIDQKIKTIQARYKVDQAHAN
ncbi:cyclin H [Nematocida sp. ERTm5]|nr:cyclin H [Nematocida sp. ERTm5]